MLDFETAGDLPSDVLAEESVPDEDDGLAENIADGDMSLNEWMAQTEKLNEAKEIIRQTEEIANATAVVYAAVHYFTNPHNAARYQHGLYEF